MTVVHRPGISRRRIHRRISHPPIGGRQAAPGPGEGGHHDGVARSAPRHDRDAGGPADVLAAKAALRREVWSAMSAAGVARFPGAAGRIPNFTGAEAAAERLRVTAAWAGGGHREGQPGFPATAGAPARAGRRQDGVHGGAEAGRAGAVLRPRPGAPRRAAPAGGLDQRRCPVRPAGRAGRTVPGGPGGDGVCRGRPGRCPAGQGGRFRGSGVRAGRRGRPDRAGRPCV